MLTFEETARRKRELARLKERDTRSAVISIISNLEGKELQFQKGVSHVRPQGDTVWFMNQSGSQCCVHGLAYWITWEAKDRPPHKIHTGS